MYPNNKIVCSDRYLNLVKSLKREAERPNFIAKMNAFKCHLVELFDIAACKCENFISCSATKKIKFPKKNKPFGKISVAIEK